MDTILASVVTIGVILTGALAIWYLLDQGGKEWRETGQRESWQTHKEGTKEITKDRKADGRKQGET